MVTVTSLQEGGTACGGAAGAVEMKEEADEEEDRFV